MKLTATQKRHTERWTRSTADAMAVAEGCWFDQPAAKRVCEFFEKVLRHSKGEWAGQPFKLLKWQADDVLKPLFGWRRADGTRRYREAYIEIPKKNGKSTLCAGISLYGLLADEEDGAEVYSAAASRDQASIVYREAASMVQQSPGLSACLKRSDSIKHMAHLATQSWYKALAADAGTNEGLNIHFLVMDEMHAQREDTFWQALMYGGAARRQPLKVIITTAGVDQDSLCYEYHTKAKAVIEGTLQDHSFFAYIRSAEWAMDRADKDQREAVWHDPRVWAEANPSLGHTITLESFREDYEKARQSPRLENAFKRYRLNIWTQQEERWLPLDHWQACGGAIDREALRGTPCYAGLDLASTSDLCALVLLFPDAGQAVLPFFWLPEDTAQALEIKGDTSYVTWARQGHLTLTPGNVTDFDVIHEAIKALAEEFDLRELAYDRWGATHLITQLQGDGLECVGFGQGFASMSAPAKHLERLILGHQIRHGQHPVLTWCVGNVACEQDAAGNIKPSKAKSKKKIDGVVALCMALGRAMVRPASHGSVYETRGLLRL